MSVVQHLAPEDDQDLQEYTGTGKGDDGKDIAFENLLAESSTRLAKFVEMEPRCKFLKL